MTKHRVFQFLLLVGLVSSASAPGQAATLYVDGQLAQSSCADYDVTSRACGSGAEAAHATVAGAAAATGPGDIVWVRAGDYTESLEPTVSGAVGQPITYAAYAGETVRIGVGQSSMAIVLDSVTDLVIEGFTIEDVRWLEATDSHYITLRGNTFLRTPASGTTGNVRFISCDHNQIIDNVMDDGNDNFLLIDSHYNLVEGNTFTEGGHSVMSIRCSTYNIFRLNYLANSIQKMAEVYDCGDDTSAVPHAFDATGHNVFEHNTFALAVGYYSTSGGNGIQYAGQDGIIRRNLFYAANVGLGMQVYSDEAEYNHRNRIYHNVFSDNNCAGISVQGNGLDNIFKNNILAGNHGVGGDCGDEGPGQVVHRPPMAGFFFEGNNIFYANPGAEVIREEFGSGQTLADVESNHPDFFQSNLDLSPGFNDETAHDFTLTNESLMIDEGVFLTQTTSAGSNTTTLPVQDARFFHDGFGIQGVVGDSIQLDGQTEVAVIQAVAYDTGAITVDISLTFTAGQGVSTVYLGTAPDVGAFEHGVTECGDGLDNDGDGHTDFPDDPGCDSADDMDETNCGDGACEGGETCITCQTDCGECTECSDSDGDGYGDPASDLCDHPERDCDNADPDSNPGANEICDDGVDNNCDGLTDTADTGACPADEDPPTGDSGGCGCGSSSLPVAGGSLWLILFAMGWLCWRRRL